MTLRRLGGGIAALVALVAIVVGVPTLLVFAAGNPWPGWTRVQLGDERAVAVGVLAGLAWVAWARVVVAVVFAVPQEWAERRRAARPAVASPLEISAPVTAAGGIGRVAARLVATALVLLPVAGRVAPAGASAPPLGASAPAATAPDPAVAAATTSAPVPTAEPDPPAPAARPGAPAASAPLVRVSEGDTLIGLARRHLGDGSRWRDIFDLNRDRPQFGGGRLTSPSVLQPGWTLLLPVGVSGASTGGVDTVSIRVGDTLWGLAHDRLEAAGEPHDDARVAVFVEEIVTLNAAAVADPDRIYPGQHLLLPALDDVAAETSAPARHAEPPAPSPAAAPPDRSPAPPTTAAPATTAGATTTPVVTSTPVVATPTTAARESPAAPATSTTDGGGPAPPPESSPLERSVDPPAPIGLGEAALLSAGVVALVAARRRARLRASRPRARVPEPAPEHVVTERALRAVDADERLLRLDVALRAAAAALLDAPAQPAVMRIGADGEVELTLTGEAVLPAPWRPGPGRWVLPGRVPVEALAGAARTVGAPCLALTQLGVDEDGREVFVDLEALGVLSIHGRDEATLPVLCGLAATLATSMFAEVINLVGVGLNEKALLDHRLAHLVGGVEEAVELATTLIGTTAAARQSTFVLRARHTSGEAWEPAVVIAGPDAAHEVSPELVRSVARRRGGLAMVIAGDVPEGSWTLRREEERWRLEPIGLALTPVGLTEPELAAVYDVLREADRELVDGDVEPVVAIGAPTEGNEEDLPTPEDDPDASPPEPPWELMVRLLGPPDVIDRSGRGIRFERSKTLELIAWLTLHRERSTRAAARTALWDANVRDATFANVVSEARRATARHVPPPEGEEWLERTLTERLPLHRLVVSDADIVRARLAHARLQPPQQAIDTLRPAVALIRDVPFAGTGFNWPDPEGITSNLVLLATSAATELAAHLLSMGDVDGVFWATGQGLTVLPGQEELIALRMRAHHRVGDLSGVRMEWETYERQLDADPWHDGEPAQKLVALRRELLRSGAS